MINQKKIQIISQPRSGSSYLYHVLIGGTDIGRPPPFNKFPTEFLNLRYAFNDDFSDFEKMSKYIYNRLDDLMFAEKCIIKTQIPNIYDLELIDKTLIDTYLQKTEDMYNIFLVRKNIVENILSHCISKIQGLWYTEKAKSQDENIYIIDDKTIRFITEISVRDHIMLIENKFNIPCHEILYYEDSILGKSGPQILEDMKISSNFEIDDNMINIVPSKDKKNTVKNYDEVVDLIKSEVRKNLCKYDGYILNKSNEIMKINET